MAQTNVPKWPLWQMLLNLSHHLTRLCAPSSVCSLVAKGKPPFLWSPLRQIPYAAQMFVPERWPHRHVLFSSMAQSFGSDQKWMYIYIYTHTYIYIYIHAHDGFFSRSLVFKQQHQHNRLADTNPHANDVHRRVTFFAGILQKQKTLSRCLFVNNESYHSMSETQHLGPLQAAHHQALCRDSQNVRRLWRTFEASTANGTCDCQEGWAIH